MGPGLFPRRITRHLQQREGRRHPLGVHHKGRRRHRHQAHQPAALAEAREVLEGLRAEGLGDIPVVVGGIIPPEDEAALKAAGIAACYTPKDFDLAAIMADITAIVDKVEAA